MDTKESNSFKQPYKHFNEIPPKNTKYIYIHFIYIDGSANWHKTREIDSGRNGKVRMEINNGPKGKAETSIEKVRDRERNGEGEGGGGRGIFDFFYFIRGAYKIDRKRTLPLFV